MDILSNEDNGFIEVNGLRQKQGKDVLNLAEMCPKRGEEIRGNSLWNFLPKNTVFFVNKIKAYLSPWNSWNFHGT